MIDETWTPFNIPEDQYTDTGNGHQKILNISWRRPKSAPENGTVADPAATWLKSALIGLGVLAGAAAAVSFAAQFVLVYATKGIPWVAAVEAAIPDAGAVVFACLGIALALKGKRALRARGGNLACIGLSLVMNLLAARAGWRGIAIWIMPSAVYAFASDTLISVIRAYELARLGKADSGRTMLWISGQAALYLLRFILAARSTCRGLRHQVLIMTPVPDPEAAAISPAPDVPELTGPPPSKTARFLGLVEDRHGPLAGIDLAEVSPIAAPWHPRSSSNVGAPVQYSAARYGR